MIVLWFYLLKRFFKCISSHILVQELNTNDPKLTQIAYPEIKGS